MCLMALHLGSVGKPGKKCLNMKWVQCWDELIRNIIPSLSQRASDQSRCIRYQCQGHRLPWSQSLCLPGASFLPGHALPCAPPGISLTMATSCASASLSGNGHHTIASAIAVLLTTDYKGTSTFFLRQFIEDRQVFGSMSASSMRWDMGRGMQSHNSIQHSSLASTVTSSLRVPE